LPKPGCKQHTSVVGSQVAEPHGIGACPPPLLAPLLPPVLLAPLPPPVPLAPLPPPVLLAPLLPLLLPALLLLPPGAPPLLEDVPLLAS